MLKNQEKKYCFFKIQKNLCAFSTKWKLKYINVTKKK